MPGVFDYTERDALKAAEKRETARKLRVDAKSAHNRGDETEANRLEDTADRFEREANS